MHMPTNFKHFSWYKTAGCNHWCERQVVTLTVIGLSSNWNDSNYEQQIWKSLQQHVTKHKVLLLLLCIVGALPKQRVIEIQDYWLLESFLWKALVKQLKPCNLILKSSPSHSQITGTPHSWLYVRKVQLLFNWHLVS